MDEPGNSPKIWLEDLIAQRNSLNFMVSAWGIAMTEIGFGIRYSLDEVERESYQSVNFLDVASYAPHFFIAAGIPMVLSYHSSRTGYWTALAMAGINVAHELAQHYGLLAGGYQLEDILAGTVGALFAAGIVKAFQE
ncbi:MAG: hypothetical protein EPN86_01690 [Nanoarchaeota archaeon]|nr:MAG: hypothetical protein EPN86_01690 [Nanoarchaeota archaeon]